MEKLEIARGTVILMLKDAHKKFRKALDKQDYSRAAELESYMSGLRQAALAFDMDGMNFYYDQEL